MMARGYPRTREILHELGHPGRAAVLEQWLYVLRSPAAATVPFARCEPVRVAEELPRELWTRLRADPARAPEHLALAAADAHGPAAAAWATERRARYGSDGARLAGMAKTRHASLARFGGAATGVGGFVTVIPDLAALAWIQSRLVFFVAAAYGFDPLDPMRPAELLVLQGLYGTPEEARAALDGVGRSVASSWVDAKLSASGEKTLVSRLAVMAGKRAGKKFAARLVPGLAIVVNAAGNERDTRALADRASAFYGG